MSRVKALLDARARADDLGFVRPDNSAALLIELTEARATYCAGMIESREDAAEAAHYLVLELNENGHDDAVRRDLVILARRLAAFLQGLQV